MNRRGFLKCLTGAVAAVAAPSLLLSPAILLPEQAEATVNAGRILCFGDSRTTFGGWQAQLILQLNATQNFLPTWGYRTNLETSVDGSIAQLSINASTYLADNSSSLAFPTHVLLDFGEHDMVAGTVNQTAFQNGYLAFIDAINAKWFNAKLYLDFPWALPVDSQYATVKGYIQSVIAARSSFVFAGVDQGVVLKGSDNGASETQDGIHFNNVSATCAAYAAAMQAAMGF